VLNKLRLSLKGKIMQKEYNQYVIKGVGNYQLCITKDNNNPSFVVPLNYIQEDRIIKSKSKQFLVLRHVIVEDIDFINFVANTTNDILFNIYSNHKLIKVSDDYTEYRGESNFKGKLVYMNIEQNIDSYSTYKIIIE
jgi:hypothetical protein